MYNHIHVCKRNIVLTINKIYLLNFIHSKVAIAAKFTFKILYYYWITTNIQKVSINYKGHNFTNQIMYVS